MENENNYSETYERLKKDGVIRPFIFVNKPKDKSDEEFKVIDEQCIPGIEKDRYYISNHGNVMDIYNDTEGPGRTDKDGYYRYSFKTEDKYVSRAIHRIEKMVFDYNPDHQSLQVNHKDGDPGNNYLPNLEWTTPKENTDHAMIYGLHKMNGSNNPNSKLTEQQVHEICKLIETGQYYDTEIAEMYGVSYANISDIHKGNIWCKVSKNYNLNNRKPISLSEEQVREICELLQEGTHLSTEIARKYNITHSTIISIRQGKIWKDISKDYNIIDEKAPRVLTKNNVHEICKMLESGEYTNKEIADKFNTTSTTIRTIAKRQIHKKIGANYNLENAKSLNNQITNKLV